MPSLDTIWLALPLLLALIMLNLAQVPPNDFWWHLRTGQIIVTTGAIPAADLFSFTRQGQPWVNQSWLMEAAFYLLYRAGGLPLIIFGHAVTISAGYALVQRACLLAARAAGGDLTNRPTAGSEGGDLANRPTAAAARIAAVGTLAAAFLGVVNWTVRPQAASFALFGAVVLIVEHDRRAATRWLWALPPLFALWANLHGGFVFGLGLLGIYAAYRAGEALAEQGSFILPAGEPAQAAGQPGRAGAPATRARRVLLATLLSTLAATANPSGPAGTVRYVLGFLQSSATQTLNGEFRPLSTRSLDGTLFVAFVALFLLVLYARRARPDTYVLASLLVFGVASLWTLRALPWFGMAAGPAAAWAVAPLLTGAPRPANTKPARANRTGAANWALLALLLACVVATLPWLRPGLPMPAEQQSYLAPHSTPVTAAKKLCDLPERTATFAEIGFASYVEWACPSAGMMIDTRFELYPADLWYDYLRVSAGQFGWEDALDRHGAAVVLAGKKEQADLVAAVRASPAWRTVYEDADALLAERR